MCGHLKKKAKPQPSHPSSLLQTSLWAESSQLTDGVHRNGRHLVTPLGSEENTHLFTCVETGLWNRTNCFRIAIFGID
jgi:hypothetical protein